MARRALSGVAGLTLGLLAMTAGATVQFDNFRGSGGLRTGATPITPNFKNYLSDNASDQAAELQNLVDFAAGPATNRASNGTDTAIDWSNASQQLCNANVASTGASCTAQLQGRVVYALVKFPAAGTYYFGAAHDNHVQVELATNFRGTDYRSFNYNLPLGAALGVTSSENAVDQIPGAVVVPTAGTCYAMRVHWTNRLNANFLRMGWTSNASPGTSFGTNLTSGFAVIPDGGTTGNGLRDPANAASYSGCDSTDSDLVINKTASVQSYTAGSNFTYTIDVFNKGPASVSNVAFIDTVPSTLTTVGSMQCKAFNASGADVTATSGVTGVTFGGNSRAFTGKMTQPLAANPDASPTGARLSCTLTVQQPAASAPNPVVNTALLLNNDADASNNTSTLSLPRADRVNVTKTVASALQLVNQPFTYTLKVSNGTATNLATSSGNGTGNNRMTVQDRLPANVQVTAASNSVSCTPLNTPAALLTCLLPTGSTIAAGQSFEFDLTAVASAKSESLTNYAATNSTTGRGAPASAPGAACDNSGTTSCASVTTTVRDFPITATVNPASAGSVSCTASTVNSGGSSTCTVTSTTPGWVFTQWSGAAQCDATTCAMTNITSAKTVQANFKQAFSVTATAGNAGGTASCSPTSVLSGENTTCTAEPQPGYAFTQWTGACAGQGAQCALNGVTGNLTSQALFAPVYSVSAATFPANAGSASCSPSSVVSGGDSTCTVNSTTSGWQFMGWSGDAQCQTTSCAITNITANKLATATFSQTFAVSASASPINGGTVSCSLSPVLSGGSSTCTAHPNAGWRLSQWSGDTQCTGASCAMTNITANKSVTATFIQTFTVAATASPTAGGTTSCTPASVDSGGNSTCTATANTGWKFDRWSGDTQCTGATCAMTNITANKSVTAAFIQTFTVAATASPTAGGTTSCTPASVDSGGNSTCTATANTGWKFDRWSGDTQCTGATCAMTNITANKSVTAAFIQTFTVAATASPTAGGTTSCTPASVDSGGNSTCTATANTGWKFDRWSGDTQCAGASCAMTNITANKSVTATFIKSYTITATVSPADAGVVSCTPATVDSGESSTCTVTSTKQGWRFVSWSGDAQCTGANCVMNNITGDKTVEAKFEQPTVSLQLTGPATAAAGATLTYDFALTYASQPTSGATATVQILLPEGAQFLSAKAGVGADTVTCVPSAATLTCTVTLSTSNTAPQVQSLQSNAPAKAGSASGTAHFSIDMKAPADAGDFAAYASVDPSGGANPPAAGKSCNTSNCASAALQVSKTAPPQGPTTTTPVPVDSRIMLMLLGLLLSVAAFHHRRKFTRK